MIEVVRIGILVSLVGLWKRHVLLLRSKWKGLSGLERKNIRGALIPALIHGSNKNSVVMDDL